MNHIPDRVLHDFLDECLTEPRRVAVAEHLETCLRCRAVIAEIGAVTDAIASDVLVPTEDMLAAGRRVFETNEAVAESLDIAIDNNEPRVAAEIIDRRYDRLANLEPSDSAAPLLLRSFSRAIAIGCADGLVSWDPDEPETGTPDESRDTSSAEGRRPHLEFVRDALERFGADVRRSLTPTETADLWLATGSYHLATNQLAVARRLFSSALRLSQDIADNYRALQASIGLAKVCARLGLYPKAVSHAEHARHLAEQTGRWMVAGRLIGRMGWLYFKQNKVEKAEELMDQAEAELEGDVIGQADVQASRARLYRRRGEYGRSLELYNLAVQNYGTENSRPSKQARARAHRAGVYSLIAKRNQIALESGEPLIRERREIRELRANAHYDLNVASVIYRRLGLRRGSATVDVFRAALFFDERNFGAATANAKQAYEIGTELQDDLIIVRARIQQCRILHGAAIGGFAEATAGWPEMAKRHAEQALELARRTQSSNLTARSLIWLGMALALPYFNKCEHALAYALEAEQLLDPSCKDYLRDELDELFRFIRARRNPVPELAETNTHSLGWKS